MTQRVSGVPLMPTKGEVLRNSTEEKSSLNFAPKFNEAEEQIRVLLRSHLPHGSKQTVAAVTGQHANHISSQFSGESGLRHVTVSAGIWVLLQFPELHAVAQAIRIIRDGESPVEIHEKKGLLIEFGTGQFCLPGMK